MADTNTTRTPDAITPERGTRAQTLKGRRTNTPQLEEHEKNTHGTNIKNSGDKNEARRGRLLVIHVLTLRGNYKNGMLGHTLFSLFSVVRPTQIFAFSKKKVTQKAMTHCFTNNFYFYLTRMQCFALQIFSFFPVLV